MRNLGFYRRPPLTMYVVLLVLLVQAASVLAQEAESAADPIYVLVPAGTEYLPLVPEGQTYPRDQNGALIRSRIGLDNSLFVVYPNRQSHGWVRAEVYRGAARRTLLNPIWIDIDYFNAFWRTHHLEQKVASPTYDPTSGIVTFVHPDQGRNDRVSVVASDELRSWYVRHVRPPVEAAAAQINEQLDQLDQRVAEVQAESDTAEVSSNGMVSTDAVVAESSQAEGPTYCDYLPYPVQKRVQELLEWEQEVGAHLEAISFDQLDEAMMRDYFKRNFEEDRAAVNRLIDEYNKTHKNAVPSVPSFDQFLRALVQGAERQAEQLVQIDPATLVAIAWAESKGDMFAVDGLNPETGGRGIFQIEPKHFRRLGLEDYNPLLADRFDPERWANSVFNPTKLSTVAPQFVGELSAKFADYELRFRTYPNEAMVARDDRGEGAVEKIDLIPDRLRIRLRGDSLQRAVLRAYNEGPLYIEAALKRAAVYELATKFKDPTYDLDLEDMDIIDQFVYLGDVRQSWSDDRDELNRRLGETRARLYLWWDRFRVLGWRGVPSQWFGPDDRIIGYKNARNTAITHRHEWTYLQSREFILQYLNGIRD